MNLLGFSKFNLAALGVASVLAGPVMATSVLDQVNPPSGVADEAFGGSYSNVQQQFTVGIAGTMTEIDLYLGTPGSVVDVQIGEGGAPYDGNWLTDQTVIVPTPAIMPFGPAMAWTSINLESSGIAVNAGDTFVIDLVSPQVSIGAANTLYSGGDLYGQSFDGNGGVTPWFNFDTYTDMSMDFRTYVDPGEASQLPEPGTILLFTAGLGGLLALRRRRVTS